MATPATPGGRTSLSPGVVRMAGLAAARASFAETGDLLHDLAGVRVGAKQAERAAAAGSARTREAKLVAVRAGAVEARGQNLPEREPGSVSTRRPSKAPWIRNIADMSFPDAVEIVDLFHAKQHLWDVAKAI